MAGVEHIAHQTVVLAQAELVAIAGHDTGGILATVLQHGQGVVDRLVNRTD
jgi:hypothetical protein